ncbi:MAG: DNA alkylation repair protein [Acidobacteriaceae bacterium]|nr:DNA alkylation repair protein [Acidobacteriaceae bacterium]MBV9780565.1 DNA alkylation repair protein [Acidobacteriaceae bacterium]
MIGGNRNRVKRTRRELERELAAAANPERAKSSVWFFKTGKGEYGEGDRFLGITVPVQRKIALRYRDLPLDDIARLLASKIHEHRFVALEILVAQYERSSGADSERLFNFYLEQTARVNNWDLVDTSAPYIVGEHLRERSRDTLYELARSPLVWERRIAIVATFSFIKHGETRDTYQIAEILLRDKHELIHKATGWALREAGKASRADLTKFIAKHYGPMNRTTLRYAIEHFSPEERNQILAGNFLEVSAKVAHR